MANVIGATDKAQSAIRWYAIDLKADIFPATVTAANWSATNGITIAGTQVRERVVMVRLSGGTAGNSYTVTCTYTLSDGDVDEVSILVRVN